MNRHRLFASFALASTFLAGCIAQDDGAGSQGSATRVEPNGTDAPSRVVVNAPDTAATLPPTTVNVGNGTAVTMKLGETSPPLPVGGTIVRLTTANGTPLVYSGWRAVTLAANQTMTITTALLGVDAKSGPPTVGLGVGTSNIGSQAAGLSVTKDADGSQRVPMFEGNFEINYGVGSADGVPVTLTSGGTQVVKLSDYAQRRVARLVSPTMELPPARCANGQYPGMPQTWILVTNPQPQGYSSTGGNESFDLTQVPQLEVGLSPSHAS